MDRRPAAVRIDDLAAPVLPPEFVALRDTTRDAVGAVSFELADIEELAATEAGLDDFGDELHREPYQVLLASVESESGLSPLGRIGVHGQVKQFLKNRLLVVDYLKRHPDALETSVEAPIVIAGMPRSGTTHLHNLIAADPRLRSLPYWESLEPVPPLAEQGSHAEVDPRWKRCAESLAMQDVLLPYMRRMHDMTPDHVHEEIHLLAIAGSTMLFDCFAPMPTWRAWYKETDQTPYYAWTRKVLQALQHQRGPTRWVLKSPQHLEQFRPLIETYPDATVVVTHRDPVAITASFCTMVTYTSRLTQESVDPLRYGRYWGEIIEDFLTAAARDRDVLPASQSLDVRFDDFMADDVATVRRIYDLAGLAFTPETERVMASFMAEHPRGKWGSVVYDLADFGLSADERRHAFRDYCERFGIDLEYAQ